MFEPRLPLHRLTLGVLVALAAGANSAAGIQAVAPGAAPSAESAAPGADSTLLGSWDLRHRDPVSFLLFGPDGLYSGGMEGRVEHWDPESGAARNDGMSPTGSSCASAAWLADGSLLVGRGDGALVRWRPGGEGEQFLSDAGSMVGVHPGGARAIVGGRDGSARIVDLNARTVLHEVPLGEHVAGPSAFLTTDPHGVVLGVNRNKRLSRGGTQDQAASALVVVDMESGAEVRRIESQTRMIRDFAVRAAREGEESDELVAVDDEGGLRIWRASDGNLRGGWDFEPISVATSVALDPAGDIVAIGREDGSVLIVSAADGEERGRVSPSDRPVSNVAIDAAGETLAIAVGPEIYLYDLGELTPRVNTFRHAGPVSVLDWSEDGSRLATGSLDRSVRTWNAETGMGELWFLANPGFVFGVSLAEHGIAAGGQDGQVRFYEPNGTPRFSVAAHKSACTSIALSPDEATLVTAGADRVVQILDASSGESRASVTGIPGLELKLAWFPDNTRAVVAASDVRVIDTQKGEVARHLGRPAAPVTSVAVSPDSRWVAAGLANRQIVLYDLEGGPTQFLHGHQGRVKAVAFSPDGATFASAGSNETVVRLWDVAAWKESGQLEGFQREVLSLAFDPTGTRLAAGSMDGMARIFTLPE